MQGQWSKYIELPVALDAITLVVSPKNTWAEDISVAELNKIWQPQANVKIEKWNQIRQSWPDRPLNLYGPGEDSGTFDYIFFDLRVRRSFAYSLESFNGTAKIY
ncbi:substrate-binding domain-containing protein [Moorena sp. SIO3I6]|uniref:substrate-binding domain-containing protein n=1 Tax=Moorena sp. SIO3I6 TaxID=2607831 RepID=UPI00344B4562